MCNQIGITGDHIKKELADLIVCLPEMYKEVATQAKKIKDASGYYQSFVGKMLGKNADFPCVPLLQYIIGKVFLHDTHDIVLKVFVCTALLEHGNTTVYEWRYGEPPLRIEEPPLLINIESEDTAAESNDGVSCY